MNTITDEFLLAQQVAGKIIDRQRNQIDELEGSKAAMMPQIAALKAQLLDCQQVIAVYQGREK